jgi:hypothetical protein
MILGPPWFLGFVAFFQAIKQPLFCQHLFCSKSNAFYICPFALVD